MWDDLVAWFQSPGGARVLQTAIIPALAILVAGVLAALIGRAAVRGAIRRADRVEAAAAIAGLVEAARAACEPEPERGARRRANRLRTEADVRTRLLPMPGAAQAADWAAARTDELRLRAAEASVTAELDELRDRLVRWVDHPARAKRIFTAPAAVRAVAAAETQGGPRRHGNPEAPTEPAVAEVAVAPAATPAPAVAPAATGAPVATSGVVLEEVATRSDAVPAWQRTRSGERLQLERDRAARARTVEPPIDDLAEDEPHTAPVQVPHAHRAEAPAATAPAAEEESIRLEAHQQARHARPVESPVPTTIGGAGPAVGSVPPPAWLDVYDDEAQVTQNLDLKTPPPVSASAVRDRGTPGEDLVPRS
jgi:hypothetical protein